MKLSLDAKELADGFFEDTRLMGIMAPVKDYFFCGRLNNLLGVDFRVNNDIEIQLSKKQRNYFFSVYEYTEQHTALTHYLYNNQNDGEYLLSEFKHLDFLWLMKGETVTDGMMEHLIACIKSIKGVQLVLELTNEQIKNREHLMF